MQTDQGDIEAEVVVNCAGQSGPSRSVPLAGVHCAAALGRKHFYVVTEQIDGVRPDLPVLRDPDGYTYFKEEVGGLVVGGFEPEAKPWVSPDDLPYPFEFQLLAEDWDHFSVLMDSALHRIPVLADTGIRKFYNGPESFTPDNQFILGEAPELAGFFVGAGFNSVGIASAGGAGLALAQWIVDGEPDADLTAVDIRAGSRRSTATSPSGCATGSARYSGLASTATSAWPNRELETARPFRRSPAYRMLQDANACFGSKMGWERANFFAPPGERPVIEYSWDKQNWQPWSSAEQRAPRARGAVT